MYLQLINSFVKYLDKILIQGSTLYMCNEAYTLNDESFVVLA